MTSEQGSPERGPAGGWPRLVARRTGQTLLALGVVALLFVAYEAFGSNLFAHRAQAKVAAALRSEWARGDDPLALPAGDAPSLPDGVGIADLFIPRLGRDYSWAIVEGTSAADLEKGPGHYRGSALPGRRGNFAVAGHRVGKGEPFLDLGRLRVGDPVIVETESAWFVYRVKGSGDDLSRKNADGVPGRQIVSPDDTRVLLPLPNHPGRTRSHEKLLTLTTCTPEFTASHRMVVYARLSNEIAKLHGSSSMPAALSKLYARS